MAVNIPGGGGSLLDTIQGMVKDGSGKLLPADWDQAISAALTRYNKDRPRRVVENVAGDGGYSYTPNSWEDDFSQVLSIEYPVDRQVPEYLEGEDFIVYKAVAGEEIRLLAMSLAAGVNMRVIYTVRHTDESMVPGADFDAVAALAAAKACETLSTAYASTADRSMGADAVNFRTKSQEYASRAKAYTKEYESHVGTDKDSAPPAASGTKDLDVDYPGGMDRLTHRRRNY